MGELTDKLSMVQTKRIESLILSIRGEKVILDSHLAQLYRVPTKNLVRAVKRHMSRFPSDFMFQLDKDEFDDLRFQFGTSSQWGGRRHRPYAFTEHGVAMLSSVLHCSRAVQVNIEIIRAFVRMRRILASHASLARKLDDLEKKYDVRFRIVFDAIRRLMVSPDGTSRRIGFKPDPDDDR